MSLAWGLGAGSQDCFLRAQPLAWRTAKGRAGWELTSSKGGTGREVRPLAASLHTCWRCRVLLRALPAMKRKTFSITYRKMRVALSRWRLSGVNNLCGEIRGNAVSMAF